MPRTVLIDEFDPIFDDNRIQKDIERGGQGVAFRIDSKGKTYWVFDPETRPASPHDEYTLFSSEEELMAHFRSLAAPRSTR